jgi:hypothetical protein
MIRNEYPESAAGLMGPCTRRIVQAMLRNRGWLLQETALKKDHGIVKLYMFDRWADPAMVKIGEHLKGFEPNWAAVYDRAMAHHLDTKHSHSRYGLPPQCD